MASTRPAIALLLFALAGCASTEVQRPSAPAAVQHGAFQQAQALAASHAGLDGAAQAANAARIDALLAQLDDAALARESARLPAGDPLYAFAGRALLARGLPLPRAFARGGWQFDGRPPGDRDGYRPPVKIGVLLPLSGGQAAVAAAVRDGFLAGYYGEQRQRPELRFYDTAGGAKAAYDRAAGDGSDFVVGPLSREDVDAVFASADRAVPLLALNRGSRTPPEGSVAFSLAPEDEGASVAEYLVARGAKRVLVVAGGDDTQRRLASAARAQLERRGVQVAADLGYSADMTASLQALVQRDPGIDAVLLALRGTQARTVAPQLALAGLGGAVRVAGSQIAAGTGKPADDAALDGIVFPTETWDTGTVANLPTQGRAAARVATARGPAARLFAFGHDAWLVTAYLERLALSANGEIAGATGRLGLDGSGNVLRRPSWSRFAGGVAQPLADGAR